MKTLIFTLLLTPISHASTTLFIVDNKPATQYEALKTLITNPSAQVLRCAQVELSPKGTIVAKKSTRK